MPSVSLRAMSLNCAYYVVVVAPSGGSRFPNHHTDERGPWGKKSKIRVVVGAVKKPGYMTSRYLVDVEILRVSFGVMNSITSEEQRIKF